MQDNDKYRKLFYFIFFSLIALHVILILQQRLYPFLDMPSHLAAATIEKFYDSPGNNFSEYFSIDILLRPNVIHFLFCSWDIFPSVEFANRLFLALYAVLLPMSVLVVIRKLKGNPVYALFSFIWLYNFNLMMGFVGFAMAIPLLIFFIALLIDYNNEFYARNRMIVIFYLIFLYFMHALAVLIGILFLIVYSLYQHHLNIRKILLEMLPAVPAMAIIIFWWFVLQNDSFESLPSFFANYYSGEFWLTLLKRFRLLAFDNYRLFERWYGYAAAVGFTGLIILYTAWRYRQHLAAKFKKGEEVSLKFLNYLVAAIALCFLILPAGLPGQSYLYARFSALFWLGHISLSSVYEVPKIKLKLLFPVTILVLVHFGLYTDYFLEFDQENKSFTREIFEPLNPEDRLVGIIADKTYREHTVYIHFPDYYTVWDQGITASSMVKHRFGLVRRKASFSQLAPYEEDLRQLNLMKKYYPGMETVLVRGTLDEKYAELIQGYREVSNQPPWRLYHKE